MTHLESSRGGNVRALSIGCASGMLLSVWLFRRPCAAADPPAPARVTAQEDHRKMMEQLGIKELRRGAEGTNRQAPNYQNTDEAKANPWPNLPDALTTK